jgi:hypothetical protein
LSNVTGEYVFCAHTRIKDAQGRHELTVLTPISASRGNLAKATNYKSDVNKVATVLGGVYPVDMVMR